MKRSFLTLALGALFFGANAQSTASTPATGSGPMITLDKEVHNYGTIQQGGNGECIFTVTNTGDEPLIIGSCQGSCGCTVPKCDTQPILPGAKSVVTVKYDTNRVGPINKNVTINSNAKNASVKIVKIEGTVTASTTPGRPTPVPMGEKVKGTIEGTSSPSPTIEAKPQ